MTKRDKRQLDLFVSFVGDVPFRDERESMSMPMVALGKRKRVKPIEWTSPDGRQWVRVTANQAFGMATIWDLDVVLWAVSQLNEAVERGLPTSPTLAFHPHDLLRTIDRDVGGDHYRRLEAALERLRSTTVETSVRADDRRRKAMFGWIEAWTHEVQESTGQSKGMTLTLPQWIYQAVVEERAVLAVPREYFALTSGLERWLYRLARRHAGKQPAGWRFTMRQLHERSGSSQSLADFARDLREVVGRNRLPEYHVELAKGQRGDELVTMIRDVTRVKLPQKRILQRL
jgi:plasmid replication initiation protein